MEAFLKHARQEQWTEQMTVLALLALLAHQKFQMNPSGEVKKEPDWSRAVTAAMAIGSPIEIVYPQFCVIPNAPKRYTNTSGALLAKTAPLSFSNSSIATSSTSILQD